MRIRERMPWQLKMGAKLILSRLPLDYAFWQRLSLFRHGPMDQPEYAYRVFRTHFDRTRVAARDGGCTILELGPGDSLFTALLGYAFGAGRVYLVDVARYARVDLAPYHAMARYLEEKGHRVPDLTGVASLEQLLERCGARYLTDGLRSLREIPSAAVDLVWSQAVLEHVRRAEFLDIQRELRRMLHPGGGASHRVDLKDHLGERLNHLRFSTGVWESDFMYRSGFYTNRIRYRQMLALFEQAGFRVEWVAPNRWERPPVKRSELAPEFRELPEEELTVSGFDVVLRPA